MKHGEQAKKDFIQFWRNEYKNNKAKAKYIAEFELQYSPESSIWWYSRECFLYEMLNWSLRTLDGETIIKMGFFLADLHRQIDSLHKQQVSLYHGKIFEVFRGQGLSTVDFDKLKKNKGGLISFNNFLSTSTDEAASLAFAESAIEKSALEFYEKALKTREKALPPNHPDLATSYNNIGSVYDDMGDYSKALEFHEKSYQIFEKALPPNHPSLAISYGNIGQVYKNMGDYSKALEFYEKSLKIREKALPPNHSSLATSYNNIGVAYFGKGDYSKALSFLEKALAIRQKSLPSTHPLIKATKDNIDHVKKKM
ncbi:unnamed protein product [Rotaria sordida]|uniref:Tetratricopeptide repeat protein n=1 Tax=Rotaria sordida TaxID=392033 RepID=A0A815P2T4_9BILA|nr:unnamed protein product [Rotaria sordida]CAF1443378.1 unnamed protein product [Rotaria sordida]